MPNHDMVVQLNIESLGSCFQFARHLDVGPRCLGVATGMIMDGNESRRVEDQGALQDLARVDRRVIDRATLLHLVGDQIVLLIEEQHAKLLDLLASHGRLQVGNERLPVAQHGPSAYFCFGHAARDLPDKPEQGDVVSRQSEGAKLRCFGRDDMAYAGKMLQEDRSRSRARR